MTTNHIVNAHRITLTSTYGALKTMLFEISKPPQIVSRWSKGFSNRIVPRRRPLPYKGDIGLCQVRSNHSSYNPPMNKEELMLKKELKIKISNEKIKFKHVSQEKIAHSSYHDRTDSHSI